MPRKNIKYNEQPILIEVLKKTSFQSKLNVSTIAKLIGVDIGYLNELTRIWVVIGLIKRNKMPLRGVIITPNYSKITEDFINYLYEISDNLYIDEDFKENKYMNLFWFSLFQELDLKDIKLNLIQLFQDINKYIHLMYDENKITKNCNCSLEELEKNQEFLKFHEFMKYIKNKKYEIPYYVLDISETFGKNLRINKE